MKKTIVKCRRYLCKHTIKGEKTLYYLYKDGIDFLYIVWKFL